jgi:hypothetical protein
MTLEKNRLSAEVVGINGRFQESCPLKYRGEKIKFAISPAFLREAMTRAMTCSIGDGKLKFDGENWVHCLAILVAEEEE